MHEIDTRTESQGRAVPGVKSFNRRRLAAAIAAASAALALAAVSPAAAGGSVLGTGGALEITQLLNHAELIKEVAQQAEMIGNQIKQYTTMIQNLKQLPESWIGEVTMPYREALTELMRLKGSVDELRDASRSADEVFSRRINAMRLLDMTPEEYLKAELELAEQRGGSYEKSYNADLNSINKAADKARAVHRMAESVPAISGNVQGFQHLASSAAMMAGELIELRTSIQRYQVLHLQEKESEQQARQLQTQRNMRAWKELEERRKRNARFTDVPFKYPEWE